MSTRRASERIASSASLTNPSRHRVGDRPAADHAGFVGPRHDASAWTSLLRPARARMTRSGSVSGKPLLPAVAGMIAAGWILAIGAAPASAQSAAEPPPGTPIGTHGAATEAHQIEQLDLLLAGRDLAAPPAGVAPALWSVLAAGDGAPTADKVALGKKLYFDPRLSADGTVSCATCHDVTRGFTDRRPVSEGIGGKLGRRNAPTTANAALYVPQFWDGRSGTLDEQARQPILNPIEMGHASGDEVVKKLATMPEYPPLFQKAFGRAMNYDDVGNAIGAFERTLIFLDAPFDRFRAGDTKAMSESAQRGLVLFEGKGRCATCHPLNPANPIGSDMKFHNIGVAARNRDFEKLASDALVALAKDSSEQELDRLALATDFSELGRFMVTKKYRDIGAFKTSQLRNVGLTRPYMHDGSLRTLWDVMDHYNKGGEANPYLDGGIEPLALTEPEIDDLVAFMFALTDVRFEADNARQLEIQKKLAAESRPIRDDALAQRKKLGFETRVSGTK